MTLSLMSAPAMPRPRFRPAAPEPLDRQPSLLEFFQPRIARNMLNGLPKDAFEQRYLRMGLLHLVYHGVHDPEAIKRVFLDNAANYRRPGMIKRMFRPVIGEGLFNAEAEPWKSQRRLMAPAFAPHSVEAFVPLFAQAAERGVARIRGDGGVVEMCGETTRTTLEVIDEALFSGQTGIPFDETSRHVRDFMGGMAELRLGLLFGLEELAIGPQQRRAQRAARTLVQRMRAFIETRAAADDPPDDFVTRLYRAFEAEHPHEAAVRLTLDNAMTFYVAGHETTANGLTWALYLLSRDPQAQDWAREEAQAAWSSGGDPVGILQRLPYLRMVWEETLRLYPPAYRLDREALADDELCGRRIRKGEIITVWPWVLHRHRTLWEEPDLFDPENFHPEAKAEHDRYQFIPFGAGPRICIGMAFAQAEALIVLSRWLAEFRFAPVPGHEVRPRGDFALRPEGGMPLAVERVSAA